MTEDITSRVIAIIDDLGLIPLGGAAVTGDTYLDSLGMDDLDVLEVTMLVEEAFSVEITDDWVIELGIEYDEAQVRHLAAYVEKLRGIGA